MERVASLIRWSLPGNFVTVWRGRSAVRPARPLAAVLGALLLASCDASTATTAPETTEPPVASLPGIVILPVELSLDEGSTSELKVFERLPDGGAGREIPSAGSLSWSSSEPAVASVERAVVRGAQLGTTRITVATADGRSASSDVRVIRAPARVEVLTAQGQRFRVMTPLEGGVLARVVSKLGRPVEGANVGFVATLGGGRVSASDVVTDAEGFARTTWTLGPIAGEQVLEVRGGTTPELVGRVLATASPGPAAIVSVQPQYITLWAGTTMQLELSAMDEYGNRIQDVPVIWEVADPTIARVTQDGYLTGLQLGTTEVYGSLDASSLSPTPGVDDLMLAPGGNGKGKGTVVVGGPESFSISVGGDGQTGEVGTRLANALRLKVVDAAGRAVSQLVVEWLVTSGAGTLSATETRTNGLGQTEVAWTLGGPAGGQTVEAHIDGRTPMRFSANALAGPVTTILITPSVGQVKEGSSLQYQATGRDRFGNPKTVTFTWSVVDPGSASVSSSGLVKGLKVGRTQVRATFAAITSGADLEITNAQTTTNNPPAASFTATCTGLACEFEDTSTDSDGQVVGRTWSFGDGGTVSANGSTIQRTYAAAGTYTVSLQVTDDKGASASATKSVTVSGSTTQDPGNAAPVAAFTSDCVFLVCDVTDRSTDSDGQIAARTWSFGDGTTAVSATGATLRHSFASAGSYTVSLQVTDNEGASATVSKALTVTGGSGSTTNNPPVASFTYTCQQLACAFDDTSTDPDGTVAARAWTFGDGGTSAEADPTRTFASAGTYTVTLKVTDDKGATGSKSQSVSVGQNSGGTQPPPTGSWQKVLADTTVFGDVVVPDGQAWLIGRNVQIQGNLRAPGGTIVMRPGSSLKFLGANPDAYVGGGMTYSSGLASDIGIWVGPQGALDIQCTPKTSWNRTGSDPSWLPGDELWITPTAARDFYARRWSPGQALPRVDSRLPAAEIINVSRDCTIEGPGHIHVHSQRAQRIEYVALRNMGVSNQAQGHVLGRYALHFHMSGDGTRGTIVRGVAAIGSKGKVFVPHASHGITMIDNVSVDSWGECFWWDFGHETHDISVDRFGCMGVQMPNALAEGGQSNHDGVSMGAGVNMAMRNSFVAGVMGGAQAVGFDWPEPTTVFGSDPKLQWDVFEGNLAHNNRGPGIRFWDNHQWQHPVADYMSYRNAGGGTENGAYFGGNEYTRVVSIQDGYSVGDFAVAPTAFLQNQSNTLNQFGRAGSLKNCVLESLEGPAILIGHRQIPATHHWLVEDCTLKAGPGQPLVMIGNGVLETTPARVHLVRSGVTPADVAFWSHPGNEGSEVLIDHEDGRKWSVVWKNGQKIVTTR